MDIADGPEVASGISLQPNALAQIVRRIAVEVAGPAAAQVDLEARFPEQSLTALKSEQLLGALVPVNLGGLGASIRDIAIACETLAERCASTGLIYAMHQIQVHCLIRHSQHSAPLCRYLTQLCGVCVKKRLRGLQRLQHVSLGRLHSHLGKK